MIPEPLHFWHLVTVAIPRRFTGWWPGFTVGTSEDSPLLASLVPFPDTNAAWLADSRQFSHFTYLPFLPFECSHGISTPHELQHFGADGALCILKNTRGPIQNHFTSQQGWHKKKTIPNSHNEY